MKEDLEKKNKGAKTPSGLEGIMFPIHVTEAFFGAMNPVFDVFFTAIVSYEAGTLIPFPMATVLGNVFASIGLRDKYKASKRAYRIGNLAGYVLMAGKFTSLTPLGSNIQQFLEANNLYWPYMTP